MDPPALLTDIACVLAPGGRAVLGHTDFETIVVTTADRDLTRRVLRTYAELPVLYRHMAAADAQMGRRLPGLVRRSTTTAGLGPRPHDGGAVPVRGDDCPARRSGHPSRTVTVLITGNLSLVLETSARLLRLLSLLQTRRDWSGTDLAARMDVTPRTVRRDIDRLRLLGYPVEARPGAGGGYRLGSGAVLPPLLLDDDEAVAVAVGLRSAALSGVAGIDETAVRALAKLEQVLPSPPAASRPDTVVHDRGDGRPGTDGRRRRPTRGRHHRARHPA